MPYVIDNGLFLNTGIIEKDKNDFSLDLVYVGQLIERKGLIQFINVLKYLASENIKRLIRFHIGGTGPLLNEIKQISLPENLKIITYGNIEYEDLPSTYSKGDIFVFPTLADEWGVVVNEAMATGIPVLGSIRSQAVEELIENKKTGWTFLPEDLDDMRKALELALSTTYEERRLMGSRAKSVIEKYDCGFASERLKDAVEYVNNNF